MIRRGFVAAAAFGLAVAGASAQQAPAPGAPPAAAPAAAAAPAPGADPVVAKVNGEEIRASEIVYLYQTLGDQVRQLSFDLLYPQLLQSSIERKLASQAAKKQQLEKRQDVQQKSAFWNERVLEEVLLADVLEKGVTEEAMKKAYADVVAGQAGEEEAKAKHMLFDNAEAAVAVIKELDAGGNFDQISERIQAQQKGRAGTIDYFKKGDIIQGFSDAAFKMRPGEYTTSPVQTQFGYHVIMLVDRRPAVPPPYAEVQDELRQKVRNDLIDKFYADLMTGAKLEKFNLDGTPLQ